MKHLRKQGNKSSQIYGRQSPLHGDHTAVPPSRLPQSIPISIPTMTARPTEGPQKRSLEGPNSEIQKIVLTDTQIEKVSGMPFLSPKQEPHQVKTISLNLADEPPEKLNVIVIIYHIF